MVTKKIHFAVLALSVLIAAFTLTVYSECTGGARSATPEIVSVECAPQVPLPNASITFTVVCANISNNTVLYLQICVGDVCTMPVKMVQKTNESFEYTFTPGISGNPPTKDGDNLSYEILYEGNVVYQDYVVVHQNNPPEISAVNFEPVLPVYGSSVRIVARASDDYGIVALRYSISCAGTYMNGTMNYTNGTYSAEILPWQPGTYLVNITARDNSMQERSVIKSLYVVSENATDKEPPVLVEMFGVKLPDGKMKLHAYLHDASAILAVKVEVDGVWYNLSQVGDFEFEATVPETEHLALVAIDAFNNTLNETYAIKVYSEGVEVKNQEISAVTIALILFLGILTGASLILFIRTAKLHIFILILCVIALILSAIAGEIAKSADAGGNIYNGNTCWSCLGLSPKTLNVSWLEKYPNGSEVQHPQWILDLLKKGKPVLVYVHQVPCTGCEIQWKDMVTHGIISADGKISGKYAGSIEFVVLDVTSGSETRDSGIEVLRTYTSGPIGTPTTVCFTMHSGKVLWWAKAGVVYSNELTAVLDEAIHLMHG